MQLVPDVDTEPYNDSFDDFDKFATSTPTTNSDSERDITTVQDGDDLYFDEDFENHSQTVLNKKESEKSTVKELKKNNEFNLKDIKPILEETTESDVEKLLEQAKKESKKETELSDDVYLAAFDFIQEQELFNIPEGMEFTVENLPKIIEYDQKVRDDKALQRIQDAAGDEAIAELFKLVYNGGTLADLQNATNVVDEEVYFKNLDLTDEQNQRNVLQWFFQNGLDPNIPNQKRMLDGIPATIDSIIGKYEGESEARKAVEYFLKDIADNKVLIEKQIQERKIEEEKAKAKRYQYEVEWRNNFLKTLQDRNWTNEKKNEISSHFNKIILTDGTELPLWDYKLKKIWENPKHAQLLFKFLSDFDAGKLEFKTAEKTPEQIATNKILGLVKQAAKSNSPKTTNIDKEMNDKISHEQFGKHLEEHGSVY